MATDSVSIEVVPWETHRQQLLEVRTVVFVEEQGVPAEIEVDEYDPGSAHFLATDDRTGSSIGTARLLPSGKIGRVAVLKDWRMKGIGKRLMEPLIDLAREHGHHEITLHGQTRTVGFYQSFGFQCVGEEFEEAGIPHFEMRLLL